MDQFIDQPYAAKIVRIGIAKDVYVSLKYDSLFSDIPGTKTWVKETVVIAAVESPGKLTSMELKRIQLSYGPEILSEALLASVEPDPGDFLYFAATQPAHPSVIPSGIEKTRSKDQPLSLPPFSCPRVLPRDRFRGLRLSE